jgi:hypothetical protein
MAANTYGIANPRFGFTPSIAAIALLLSVPNSLATRG